MSLKLYNFQKCIKNTVKHKENLFQKRKKGKTYKENLCGKMWGLGKRGRKEKDAKESHNGYDEGK